MRTRLLFVEDDFSIRLWLSEYLADVGFDVIEAEDGDQALALLDQGNAFDLLLTDIRMPGRTDGNAVAMRAKRRFPGIPVIYMSGCPDALTNPLRACDAFVAKPFTGATLLGIILRTLGAATQATAPAILVRTVPASAAPLRRSGAVAAATFADQERCLETMDTPH